MLSEMNLNFRPKIRPRFHRPILNRFGSTFDTMEVFTKLRVTQLFSSIRLVEQPYRPEGGKEKKQKIADGGNRTSFGSFITQGETRALTTRPPHFVWEKSYF